MYLKTLLSKQQRILTSNHFHRILCNFSTQEKTKPKRSRKEESDIIPRDLFEHFCEIGKSEILDTFPGKVLKKKRKTVETFYNTERKNAEIIAEHLIKDFPEHKPILEINPGPGYLTEELLARCKNKLLVFEDSPEFSQVFQVRFHSSVFRDVFIVHLV